MLSLAAPLWLLGLALLPVIRWLHRGGRHRRALPVSHIGLWQGAAAHSPAAGEKQPPDPAWRRRALLAALLFLALAEPRLPPPQQAVTLWVDDSLSMLTREAQGTRLALAMAQAGALLAELPRADVEVRALSDPWQRLAGPGLPGDEALAALAVRMSTTAHAEPAAPPAALLHAQRQHWLLTDGAHAALQQWPDGRRADRVVRVGSVTRNVGLAQMSARRSLDAPGRIDLLIKLSNGGNAVETRELVIASGAAEPARSSHRLAPGAAALVKVQVAAADRVRATLEAADTLAADDELVLDLIPLRPRRVAVDATCPAALRAAVASHPALMQAGPDAGEVAAVLDCGNLGATGNVPTLRVRDGDVPRRPPGAAQWSAALAESQRVRLDPGRLPLIATLTPRSGDMVLLAAGDEPALVSRAGATPLIETSLDFDALAALRGAETPLLVNVMFEHLLGGRLLGGAVTAGRGTAASLVVPAAPSGLAAATTASASQVAQAPARAQADLRLQGEGTRAVLWVALLALLWELAALARQWVRLGRPSQA